MQMEWRRLKGFFLELVDGIAVVGVLRSSAVATVMREEVLSDEILRAVIGVLELWPARGVFSSPSEAVRGNALSRGVPSES